jgi:photosystem II stability/assembly factor-like uncharacterized protein
VPERGRRPVAIVGLLVLAGVVGYLSYLSLLPRSAAGSTAGVSSSAAAPSTLSSSSELPTVAPSPTSTATASATPQPVVAAGPALPLEVVDATVALRAQPGSCATGGGTLQRTINDGRDWTTLKVPAASILRVRSTSATSFWLVGTNSACVPQLYRTADAGKTWSVEAGTNNAWHPLPVPASGVVPTQLHAPTGNVALPCAKGVGLVDLAGITLSDAVVLCADGTVFATADGGATWRARTAVPSSGALAAVSPTTLWVASAGPVAGCAGVQVSRSTDGGATWRVAGCAVGAQAGAVGLAFAGTDGMLWDGPAVWTSRNGGSTWVRAGA